ncbi:MAG: alcohol dehydrogenase catalytic domain-containing protein [Calditrichaeota bacterium]|nr:alcohol dehydrogenase catalytic domain-containing protein [Calditrichota bacterium]
MSRFARAMVLTEFNAPLELKEFPLTPPSPGEILVKIESSGICGSDLHMWKGNDPRTPRPIILGHEGVGRIESMDHGKKDVLGQPLHTGDRVIWDRGVPCMKCYYCQIEKQPSLCPNRKIYGINLSSAEPPHLRGSHADYIYLFPETKLIKLDPKLPPEIFSAAACSGATAAHTIELANIQPEDTVVILGAGSLGLFALRMALDRGASQVVVVDIAKSQHKLEMARIFGAEHVLVYDETTLEERVDFVRQVTGGRGADVVIEASGAAKSVEQGLHYLRRGGKLLLPGAAVPIGDIKFPIYEGVVSKNVTIQGVWVSDTTHLYESVSQVARHPDLYKKMVTRVFPLEKANDAFQQLLESKAIKIALKPELET